MVVYTTKSCPRGPSIIFVQKSVHGFHRETRGQSRVSRLKPVIIKHGFLDGATREHNTVLIELSSLENPHLPTPRHLMGGEMDGQKSVKNHLVGV